MYAFDDLVGTECDGDELIVKGYNSMNEDLKEYFSKLIIILDKFVEERELYSSLYNHIKPFSYRIES